MRRRGTTQQRLWLGPREYSGRGGRWPYADSHSYSYRDRASKSDSYAIWYDSAYADCHADYNSASSDTKPETTQTSANAAPATDSSVAGKAER